MKAKLKSNVVLRIESDDFAIIYNLDTGESFVIDPVAVFISQNLNGEKDSQEIAKLIAENFENAPDDSEKFVVAFIENLVKNNLAESC